MHRVNNLALCCVVLHMQKRLRKGALKTLGEGYARILMKVMCKDVLVGMAWDEG